MNWSEYFAMMEDWKRLPAYKAEPRIDSFVGFFLPDMASEFLGDKIVGIIPELPIRLGTVKPEQEESRAADLSYKVDFFLLGASGMNYFVEFKSDSASRRDKQDGYLTETENKGMASIVRGIARIEDVSPYKTKYGHLLKKLKDLGLMDEQRNYSGKGDKIEVVYVQPRRNDNDTRRVMDFRWMSDWMTAKHPSSEFALALSKSLSRWSDD